MEKVEQDAIGRILAGDPDAYRVLVDRHFASVHRITYRVTGNAEDAEEAAQEAFLRAYNHLPEFRHQAAFGTWIYRIAMNCAMNIVDRRSRDLGWQALPIATEPALAEGGRQARTAFQVADLHPGPERALLAHEATALRERAMRTLTPMERSAFVLRHMEDVSIDAIAEALHVPASAAKQAVFRAVAKLRRALAPVRTSGGVR